MELRRRHIAIFLLLVWTGVEVSTYVRFLPTGGQNSIPFRELVDVLRPSKTENLESFINSKFSAGSRVESIITYLTSSGLDCPSINDQYRDHLTSDLFVPCVYRIPKLIFHDEEFVFDIYIDKANRVTKILVRYLRT